MVRSRWEYDISLHTIAELEARREELGLERSDQPAVFCDAQGVCFFDQGLDPNVAALKSVLNQRGADGWQLVQLDYRADRLICTWRRQVES